MSINDTDAEFPEVETQGPAEGPGPEPATPVNDEVSAPAAFREEPEGDDEGLDETDGEERGAPVGHVLAGGSSVLTGAGALLWQTFGLAGAVVAGGVAVGGGALMVAHRFRRRSGAAGWSRRTTTTRVGSSRIPGLGGRASRAGGKGPSLGGRAGGKGRGAAMGMPGVGGRGSRAGGGAAGKAAGKRAAGGRAGAGRTGGAGASRMSSSGARSIDRAAKQIGKAGARTAKAIGSTSAGHKVAAATKKAGVAAGKAGRAATVTARRLDAATGGRAGHAARRMRRLTSAAGRRIDAATGGRAGRWWARNGKTASRAAGIGALFMALVFGPWWLIAGLLAGLAGVWSWRRKRRQAKEAAETTAKEQAEAKDADGQGEKTEDPKQGQSSENATKTDPKTGPQAIPQGAAGDDLPRIPRATRRGTYATRSTRMNEGFPLLMAAADVQTAGAAYAPESMWQVSTDMKQLPDVIANVALGLRAYVTRLESEYPLGQPVVDELAGLYGRLLEVAESAQQVEPVFRAVHAEDLRRGETPRTNESTWNVE